MTINLKRNLGLDLARFIAIGLVVVSHFGHKMFDILGFWGVELFFGLSGYLIGNYCGEAIKRPNAGTSEI